jgi:hypothetical protein
MFKTWEKLKELLSARCTFTGYCSECGTPIGACATHSKPVIEQVKLHDEAIRGE